MYFHSFSTLFVFVTTLFLCRVYYVFSTILWTLEPYTWFCNIIWVYTLPKTNPFCRKFIENLIIHESHLGFYSLLVALHKVSNRYLHNFPIYEKIMVDAAVYYPCRCNTIFFIEILYNFVSLLREITLYKIYNRLFMEDSFFLFIQYQKVSYRSLLYSITLFEAFETVFADIFALNLLPENESRW